ncbi:MAG TPA: hypothetical protein VNZ02_17725 [Steroidobacteraceae bacterium]|jgi:hypothetical protein|nr:hypothetical protein [Steroidobacteraceae bacterium]
MTETRAIGQRVIWAGMVLSVMCLAYFYMLDHILFFSVGFSPIFRFLLMPDLKAAWISVAICCLAALWNRPAPVLRLVEVLEERAVWVAVASIALFALGAVAVYHNYPLSMDEYAAVFQAKIFAAGHLSAQLPPSYIDWLVVRGFNGEFLVASPETGRVIEEYWPGFALLLAPFEYLQAQWLCNACLAGLALLLMHRITKEITHERLAAGWALLFALASAAFAANAISYYSLQSHLTANLLFAALLQRPNGYRAFCAGLTGSLALILHNPLPHTLFAIPWLLAMVLDRGQRRLCLPLILGYLPGIGFGLGWLWLRADIGSAGQTLSGTSGLVHGVFTWPTLAVLNTRAASFVKMWVWAVPCLFVFAIIGCIRYRENSKVRLLTASAVLTFLGYLFVTFDQGHGWGYRYFHSAWGVIPILAGCAMTNRPVANPKTASFAGACAILSLVIMVPFQLNEIQQFISQHLAQLGAPKRPGNNVYFIRPRRGFYVADMVQMDPYLRDADLYLASRGGELDEKMVLTNWPAARRVSTGPAYEQWYLGPSDQRRARPGERYPRFELIAEAATPPSAADR